MVKRTLDHYTARRYVIHKDRILAGDYYLSIRICEVIDVSAGIRRLELNIIDMTSPIYIDTILFSEWWGDYTHRKERKRRIKSFFKLIKMLLRQENIIEDNNNG